MMKHWLRAGATAPAAAGRADTGRADTGRADTGRADTGRADTGRAAVGRAAGALLALLAALAVLAVLAGCGTQHAGAPGGSGRPPTSARNPATSLTIQVTPAPGTAAKRWTLQCRPDGGTLPGAASACTAIARTSNPFGPVPRGMMCSMIDSGPQTATVAGTWDGKMVDTRYSRTNSCQTARWNKLASMFPAAVAPGPRAPGGGQVNPGGPMIPAPGRSAGSSSGGSGGMSG